MIDVFVRVSLIGIEILTIDARIVIASVDTYLRFAEAVNRLDLMSTETQGLPELMEGITEGGASSKTKGVLQGAREALFGDEDEDEDEDSGSIQQPPPQLELEQQHQSAPLVQQQEELTDHATPGREQCELRLRGPSRLPAPQAGWQGHRRQAAARGGGEWHCRAGQRRARCAPRGWPRRAC